MACCLRRCDNVIHPYNEIKIKGLLFEKKKESLYCEGSTIKSASRRCFSVIKLFLKPVSAFHAGMLPLNSVKYLPFTFSSVFMAPEESGQENTGNTGSFALMQSSVLTRWWQYITSFAPALCLRLGVTVQVDRHYLH